jgi:hypothetical protein
MIFRIVSPHTIDAHIQAIVENKACGATMFLGQHRDDDTVYGGSRSFDMPTAAHLERISKNIPKYQKDRANAQGVFSNLVSVT